MNKLDWRRASVKTTPHIAARKTAQGHWPGWTYILEKRAPFDGAAPIWHAWLLDESQFGRHDGQVTQLGSGSYHQALTAVLNHHHHPGGW